MYHSWPDGNFYHVHLGSILEPSRPSPRSRSHPISGHLRPDRALTKTARTEPYDGVVHRDDTHDSRQRASFPFGNVVWSDGAGAHATLIRVH